MTYSLRPIGQNGSLYAQKTSQKSKPSICNERMHWVIKNAQGNWQDSSSVGRSWADMCEHPAEKVKWEDNTFNHKKFVATPIWVINKLRSAQNLRYFVKICQDHPCDLESEGVLASLTHRMQLSMSVPFVKKEGMILNFVHFIEKRLLFSPPMNSKSL